MDVKTKKTIEKVFFNYKKFLSKTVTSTVDWAESGLAIDYSKPMVKNTPTGAKETRLCQILDDNQKALRWCYVVEKTLESFKFTDRDKLIQAYFFENRGEVCTCKRIGICRATFFNWKNEIIEKAFLWAKELKVL